MEIKIRKKKYNLDKVSIYISDLYSEYAVLSNEAATITADFELIQLENKLAIEEAESQADKIRANIAMFKAAKDLKKESLGKAKEASEKRNQVLMEIILLNGYTWEEEEWLKVIGEDDFKSLIEDLFSGKKKEDVKPST